MSFIRKIKKGGAVYLARVESYREGGKVKQRVLEYIGKEVGGEPVVKVDIQKVDVASVKRYLDIEVLHRLACELGLPEMLGKRHKPLLAMVYAHLLQKKGINKLPEWFEHTTMYNVLQCKPFTTKGLYESLTGLDGIEFEMIERQIISFWRSLAPGDNNTVVLDVTDTYFAGSTAESKPRRGKDGNISRLLQIGLVVSFVHGFPLLHKTYEGNIHNVKVFQDLLKEIADNGLKGIVLDRGFFSKDNIKDMVELGMNMIVGVKQTGALQKQYLDKIVRDEIYDKDHQVVLKETTVYTKSFDYLEGKLIVIYNPALEVLKRDKILAEQKEGDGPADIKYAGYSLVFHNTGHADMEVIKKYFDKDIVERAFKTLKGPLSLRPIRVWLRTHVQAHVKLCFLAMSILSLLDFRSRKLKINGIEALRQLQHAYKVKLKHAETKKEWEKVVTLTKAQQDLLKALKM
jgi:transposase